MSTTARHLYSSRFNPRECSSLVPVALLRSFVVRELICPCVHVWEDRENSVVVGKLAIFASHLDRQRDTGSVLETPCLWQGKDTGLRGTSNGIRPLAASGRGNTWRSSCVTLRSRHFKLDQSRRTRARAGYLSADPSIIDHPR